MYVEDRVPIYFPRMAPGKPMRFVPDPSCGESFTRAAIVSLTIGGFCLGSLTAAASRPITESVTNAAAPSAASRTLPNTMAHLTFFGLIA